jgi:hypothetical protein
MCANFEWKNLECEDPAAMITGEVHHLGVTKRCHTSRFFLINPCKIKDLEIGGNPISHRYMANRYEACNSGLWLLENSMLATPDVNRWL